MPGILEALRAMDDSGFAAEHQKKDEPSPISALVAALDVDSLNSLRDEDVTVAMLRGCMKRLRDAENKLGRLSSKKAKGEALAEVTNSKAQNGIGEAQAPVNAKKKQMLVKKMIGAAKQSLRGVKFFKGYGATSRDAKAQDMMSRAEFEAVFAGGTQIQPTKGNKPNSQVIIRQFNSEEASVLLGAAAGGLKGELWLKGGQPTHGGLFFGGGGFAKGKKLGSTSLSVQAMKVTYSIKSQQMTAVFSVVNSTSTGDDSDY